MTLARTLKRMVPNSPLIVMSGRMDDPLEQSCKALGISAVLHKPFTGERMSEVLQQVLAEWVNAECGMQNAEWQDRSATKPATETIHAPQSIRTPTIRNPQSKNLDATARIEQIEVSAPSTILQRKDY